MRGYKVSKVLQVFRVEYLQWVTNPKLLMFMVLLVFIRELVILPILRAAQLMDTPVNMWEPCIAVGNSGIILLFLPVFYIMLMSDFPKLNNNMFYFIPRVGRKNWFAGQLLFQAAAAVTYLSVVILSTLVQVMHNAYALNAWSLVVTRFSSSSFASQVDMANLVPLNLYYQMPPLRAFIYTYILLFLYLSLWSCILLIGFMYGKKVWSFFLSIIIIAVGMGFTALKSGYMWLFPSAHAILWLHCQSYYRKYVFPPGLSVLLLCVVCILFILYSGRKFQRVNLDNIMENA